MRRPALLLLLALVALAACANPGPVGSVRAAAPGTLTPEFAAMRTVLLEAQRAREAGGAGSLPALAPEVSARGIALLRHRMPHDLRRGDVERYLDGRAAFGRALKHWAAAAELADPRALSAALDELTGTYWAWVDASKGLPPERAV